MTRRLHWFVWVALHAVLSGCAGDPGGASSPANPGDGAEAGEAIFAPEEPTELWFVELDSAPLLRGGDGGLLDGERVSFKRRAVDLGFRYRQRFSFSRLWNGLSIRVAGGSSARLAELPGVKAVYPIVSIALDDGPSRDTSEPDLFTANVMSGADIVRSQLGFTGRNIKVGVIDSGIDYDHPDLGGCFGPGCRVAYGHDFVGDTYDSNDPGTQPVPDDDPDDCTGHGSHVAGIIGANGIVQGVAPDVTFGAYRVFGCSGNTTPDVMIRAMEAAEKDGMRVVNMSIGSPFQWPGYPSATAADELAASGVVVVASIGNSGDKGLWAAGAPGVGERVIGTASIESTRVNAPALSISPNNATFGYKRATGAPVAPLSGSAPLVRTGTMTTPNDACDALAPGSLTGAIALIRRGGCAFNVKAINAQAAGATGVVFYNNAAGSLSASAAGTTPILIPVVTITKADGEAIDARLGTAPITQTWTDQVISSPNPTANQISSFSSYGPSAALTFKPDIAAPGGSIYSTVPIELGRYDTYSGTSMASPHVAGAVALLLSARPELAPRSVLEVLQNNAIPAIWSQNPTSGVPDSTVRQGAGLIRIDRAIQSTALLSPGKLAIGESAAGPFTATLTLSNKGDKPVTYRLTHVPAVSTTTGNHWAPTAATSGATRVAFSSPSVTVAAGEATTLSVTITADTTLADGSLFGGYLVFTPQGGTVDDALRVPYAGFKGDYQSVPILTPADQRYPWLGKRRGTTYEPQRSGATYTLQGSDIPYVVVHLDHNAARVRLDVTDAATGKPKGRALDLSYVGQNGTETGSTKYAWRGLTTLGKTTKLVPNGNYLLKLSVLKALGNEGTPADWETWTSPTVTLNHP